MRGDVSGFRVSRVELGLRLSRIVQMVYNKFSIMCEFFVPGFAFTSSGLYGRQGRGTGEGQWGGEGNERT